MLHSRVRAVRESPVDIDHEPREAVGLAVQQAVGRRPVRLGEPENVPPESCGAGDPFDEELPIGLGARPMIEEADADRGMFAVEASSEEPARGIENVDGVAAGRIALDPPDRAGEEPGVAVGDRLHSPLAHENPGR